MKAKRKKSLVGYIMPYDFKKKWLIYNDLGIMTSDISIYKLCHVKDYKKVRITIQEL